MGGQAPNLSTQPAQPPWSPAAEKGFAAAIVMMVAVPIAIALFAAYRSRRSEQLARRSNQPLGLIDQQDHQTHQNLPQHESLEGRHWIRNRIFATRRLLPRPLGTRWWDFIYARPLWNDEERGETLGDPDRQPVQSASPTNTGYVAQLPMMQSAMPVPIANTGLVQNTIPPSGPIAPAMPQGQGRTLGGTPFFQPPLVADRAHPSSSVAPADPAAPSLRRGSHASHSPNQMEKNPQARNDPNNIPLAMPLWPSRSGQPSRRRQFPRLHTSISQAPDEARSGERATYHPRMNRSSIVSDLLTSVREGNRAPQNTEFNEARARSPQTDGQDDDQPRPQPSNTYPSPLDFMRRSHAVNQVLRTTQEFIGNYSDIRCLIAELPNAAPSSRPKKKQKARTVHF